jgi:glycosyltransferase involved in cell wall biosynthesis
MFGIPTVTGQVDVQVMTSILYQLPYIIEGHHGVMNNIVPHTLVHVARNTIAKSAIDNGCDYLLFIDSDCVLPIDTLKRLVAHDKDVVAGMYFGKVSPFPPIVYKKTKTELYRHLREYPENSLIEVDAAGMGCCLIKVDVLKNFIYDKVLEYEDETTETVKESFAFEPMAAPGQRFVMGEDASFCRRCQDLGYKIYVDTAIQCAHQTTKYVTDEYFKKTEERMKTAEQAVF